MKAIKYEEQRIILDKIISYDILRDKVCIRMINNSILYLKKNEELINLLDDAFEIDCKDAPDYHNKRREVQIVIHKNPFGNSYDIEYVSEPKSLIVNFANYDDALKFIENRNFIYNGIVI